jgi:hypothetical protein
LEAAHVLPYRGPADNHPSNGLILRADVHTMFDLDLLWFDPKTLAVHLHPSVRSHGYNRLPERELSIADWIKLNQEALNYCWERFEALLKVDVESESVHGRD